jgi:hypothetical protein
LFDGAEGRRVTREPEVKIATRRPIGRKNHLAFLILSLLLLLCALTRADDRPIYSHSYRVKTVKGSVLMRAPWELEWQPVQAGQNLIEGTLINIEGPSTIMVEGRTKNLQGLRTEAVRVGLQGPLVMRLEPGAIREIALNAFFFERLPSAPDGVVPPPAGTVAEDNPWGRAWQWFTAMVPRDSLQQVMNDLSKTRTVAQVVDVAVRARRIKLFAPLNNALVIAERLPVSVKIMWEKTPLKDVDYEVRLWRAGIPRGAPLTLTKLSYYTANIPTEGDYFIQISALNAPWHSDAVEVHIVSSQKRMAKPKEDTSDLASEEPASLEPKLPPNGMEVMPRSLPVTLAFTWDLDKEEANRLDGFELVLYDRKDHVMERITTKTFTAQATFRQPGDYRWRVEGVNYVGIEHSSIIRWTTPEQELGIRLHEDLDNILAKVVKTHTDHLLYLGSDL